DQYEAEADRVAAQVIAAPPPPLTSAALSLLPSAAPVRLMRAPDKCLDNCEAEFNDCLKHSAMGMECIGARSVCVRNCAPPPKAEEPPQPAPAPPKQTPAP